MKTIPLPSAIKIPVSLGELVDKITILQIKSEKIRDTAKLAHVRKELKLLEAILEKVVPRRTLPDKLVKKLKAINLQQWEVEELLRKHEKEGDFDYHFINLARSAYQTNDKRMAVKREINLLGGSKIQEVKSHS